MEQQNKHAKHENHAVILVAAGKGQRMGGEIPKQFLVLDEKEILAHTVSKWENHEQTAEIVLVVGTDDVSFVEDMVQKYGWQKVRAVVAGGAIRGDSVCNGLDALSADVELVSIHDGVRPFVTECAIDRAIAKAQEMGAVVVGVPVKDTVKRCDANGLVLETPKREEIWLIQTPQTFRKELICSAYEKAKKADFAGTDDASIAEFAGYPVEVVLGDYCNIKITTEEDLLLAECFLKEERT